VISLRGHITSPSKRDGTAIAGFARKYLRDPSRIIGGSAFDRFIVAGKPSIVAFGDGDHRVPSDKLRHLHPCRFDRRGDRAAGLAGALFEEWRGKGAAGIGLSTGFLKTVESVKQTLLYRRTGDTNAAISR
jgi:hypothetical protein